MTTTVDKDKYKFRGRKLILEWGKLKIEISKLPYGKEGKDSLFKLYGSDVILANVYEDSDGKLFDEIIGSPAGPKGDGTCLEGRLLEDYFTGDEFWKAQNEVMD